jgi:hypothetical protein
LNELSLSVKLGEIKKDITYFQHLTIDELVSELKKLKFTKEKKELK